MGLQHGDSPGQILELLRAGRAADAAQRCRALVEREPGNAPAHNLMGVILAKGGDAGAAAGHFARAAALNPAHGEYQRNLGVACSQLGRDAEAADCLARAIALDGNDHLALNELGNLHWRAQRFAGAAGCYERVLTREPRNVAALMNLGIALTKLGRLEAAAGFLERALALEPQALDICFSLAAALSGLGYQQRAVSLYEEIGQTRPDFPGLQVNLGLALMKLGRCEAAIAHYDRAIAANPADYMAHNNRGNALRNQQRMDEAVAGFRRALEIHPGHASAHSNLLLTLNYMETSQEAIYQESLRFDAQHAAALRPAAAEFAVSRDPDRPLNVGYISADFRSHSVAYFLKGILAARDRSRIRVFCYSNVERADDVTGQFQALADQWRPITGVADADVAAQIRADPIDILVDLGGHTGGNRLLVFARKPAPVQVTWLGYPNTTGMRAMDYRITDAVADPAGEADALHTETLVRLPDGFLCYAPDEAPFAAAVTPPAGGAAVTFGSFNTLAKVTPDVIRVWADILRLTPGAHLLLKSESLDDEGTRGRYLALFARHGIAAERVQMLPWVADHREHLGLYARVDIALDTFPYNGATTTCEALWMGVPVVVLSGQRHAARVGAGIMTHAGMPEWIAGDESGYIALAVSRAADRTALAASRTLVSRRMRSSVMSDAVRFAAALERAYRDMWVAWCRA